MTILLLTKFIVAIRRTVNNIIMRVVKTFELIRFRYSSSSDVKKNIMRFMHHLM